MCGQIAFSLVAELVLLVGLNADMAFPLERFYRIDQKTCDKIQDDMTEAQVNKIIGGPPHAASYAIFAGPFSGKAMPVTLKQWWGEKSLIEVHFDEASKTVIYKRVIEGTDRRFACAGSQ